MPPVGHGLTPDQRIGRRFPRFGLFPGRERKHASAGVWRPHEIPFPVAPASLLHRFLAFRRVFYILACCWQTGADISEMIGFCSLVDRRTPSSRFEVIGDVFYRPPEPKNPLLRDGFEFLLLKLRWRRDISIPRADLIPRPVFDTWIALYIHMPQASLIGDDNYGLTKIKPTEHFAGAVQPATSWGPRRTS